MTDDLTPDPRTRPGRDADPGFDRDDVPRASRGDAPRPRRSNGNRSRRPVRRRDSVGRINSAAVTRRARLIIPAVALVVLVAIVGFGVWNTFYRSATTVEPGQAVSVEIAPGSSTAAIAVKLAEAGVIKNARQFRMRAEALGVAQELKPGEYEFVTGSRYDDVIEILTEGVKPDTVTITIPEGWRLERVAERVEKKLGIPAEQFAELAQTGAKRFDYPFLKEVTSESLEGYLFPKTYTFETSATAEQVIDRMLKQYEKETAGLDYSYAKSKNLTSHDITIMASLVEREASVDSDRPKVAAVINNRMKIGMRLQMCSSVQYVLNISDPTLTSEQIAVDSPYNTYQNAGLPPGPICSPGLASIKASLQPSKAKYLYFVLTHKDGRHSFATNYDDFLRLKAQSKNGLK